MKKNLLFSALLIFLMVMNGVLLFMLLNQNEKPPRPSRDFMAQELNFSVEQTTEFMRLERQHRSRMRALDDELIFLRRSFFTIDEDAAIKTSQKDSLSERMGVLFVAKNNEIYNHFQNIASICNPEQREQLEEIMQRAMRHGPGRGGPPGGHPKGPPPH